MSKKFPPWQNDAGKEFLAGFVPYLQMLKLIRRTLDHSEKTHSNEIRAACSMVIMLCREDLWPAKGESLEQRDEIIHLAATKLTRIRQLYEQKSKINPELQGNPQFRSLLNSLDQETRILEARLTDPKPVMPNQPPCTWGDFWI